MTTSVEVNGRRYRRPARRTAVICLDGVDPRYVDDAFARDVTPRLRELAEGGCLVEARSQLPSFTNPNNLSIVTGAPPSVHGLPGNHYLAPDGLEVQLDRPELLWAPSIHAALGAVGTRVLAVTTKDKLRRLLGAGGVPCVSAERADELSLAPGGAPVAGLLDCPKPGIYEPECSIYALELAGVLAYRMDVELLYVSTTDAVQHAAAPGSAVSDAFLAGVDRMVGRFLDDGWRLGLVADHGMNAKTDAGGRPNVRWLGDLLPAAGVDGAQVVLPITDPYVAHHAALGSACWVHVADEELGAARGALERIDGVEEVLSRDEAAARLSLPPSRIGDLVVLGDASTVFGKRQVDHDLSTLRGPLRSHGGRHEQAVPLFLSERPAALPPDPSNADVHHLLIGAP